MVKTVALFDFDGTLTHGDSLVPFLIMSAGIPRFTLALLMACPFLAGYALRLVRNNVAKEALLYSTISGFSDQVMNKLGKDFAQYDIPFMLRKETIDRLRDHQCQGHCCILVSASLNVYLEPWANNIGFDYCIATRLALDLKGEVSGKFDGANCHGLEKVRRLKLLFDVIGQPDYIYAYGDTDGDIPMFEMSDEAYWVKKKGISRALGIKKIR